MTTPTDEEKLHAQACYAVAMHIGANKRVGRLIPPVLIVSGGLAYYFGTWWVLLGGIALLFVAYFILMQSCSRFISQSTGMPAALQALYSNKYKTDPNFADAVNKLL